MQNLYRVAGDFDNLELGRLNWPVATLSSANIAFVVLRAIAGG